MSKRLMSRVRPGVADVLASFFLFVSMFMKEDLPTFDLPATHISGRSYPALSRSYVGISAIDLMNTAFFII